MILELKEIKELPEFSGLSDSVLTSKIEAVELMIGAYTNNNFQNRFVRFVAESTGDALKGGSPYLKAGDTIQITKSDVNDGLYVITSVNEDSIAVSPELFPYPKNLVTKIEYPADVKSGVLEMLKWDVQYRSKTGIKSETLSRHSVTYADVDANNSVMGYPVSLLGFLKPYVKARF